MGKVEKWATLYVGPNKDGSRKNCFNCVMYVGDDPDEGRCQVLGDDVVVTRHKVCGYYINGERQPEGSPSQALLAPETAGLVEFKGEGTSCDNCDMWVNPNQCRVVEGYVEDLGCCSGWRSEILEEDRPDVVLIHAKNKADMRKSRGMF